MIYFRKYFFFSEQYSTVSIFSNAHNFVKNLIWTSFYSPFWGSWADLSFAPNFRVWRQMFFFSAGGVDQGHSTHTQDLPRSMPGHIIQLFFRFSQPFCNEKTAERTGWERTSANGGACSIRQRWRPHKKYVVHCLTQIACTHRAAAACLSISCLASSSATRTHRAAAHIPYNYNTYQYVVHCLTQIACAHRAAAACLSISCLASSSAARTHRAAAHIPYIIRIINT